MVLATLEIGITTSSVERGPILGQTRCAIKDSGKRTKEKASVGCGGQMGLASTESGVQTNATVWELSAIRLEFATKGSTSRAKGMEREKLSGPMVKDIKECGKITNETAKASISGPMGAHTRESGRRVSDREPV